MSFFLFSTSVLQLSDGRATDHQKHIQARNQMYLKRVLIPLPFPFPLSLPLLPSHSLSSHSLPAPSLPFL